MNEEFAVLQGVLNEFSMRIKLFKNNGVKNIKDLENLELEFFDLMHKLEEVEKYIC